METTENKLVKTAEEFYNDFPLVHILLTDEREERELFKLLKAFAKAHVEAALSEAAKKARPYEHTFGHISGVPQKGLRVSERSIIEAYPLTNID